MDGYDTDGGIPAAELTAGTTSIEAIAPTDPRRTLIEDTVNNALGVYLEIVVGMRGK